MPARQDGGLYTTPKSERTQYGHAAGVDSRCCASGSARLICTKHSVQSAWAQQRE
jgi:hypothetical protein